MGISAYDRPGFFYLWSFLIPCACWLAAGYISHIPGLDAHTTLQGTLGIIGLAAPIAVVAAFIGPVTLVLAQLISLAFGFSAEQFRITANLIFFAYGFLWHIPLASIKGYYQANLVAEG